MDKGRRCYLGKIKITLLDTMTQYQWKQSFMVKVKIVSSFLLVPSYVGVKEAISSLWASVMLSAKRAPAIVPFRKSFTRF